MRLAVFSNVTFTKAPLASHAAYAGIVAPHSQE